jgi:DNA-binding beta-propeller fold protein YncE
MDLSETTMIGKRLSRVAIVAVASMAFAGCSSATKTPESDTTAGQTAPLPSRVSAAIATEHGPENFYVTKDGLYVGNHRGGSIQRIDPATNRIVSTTTIGGELELNEVSGVGDVLWTCTNVDSVLHRIDLTTGTETLAVPAECEGGIRNLIDGRLWQAPIFKTHDVLVLDGQTGKILQRFPLDPNTWWGLPILVGSRVAIATGNGILLCQLDGTSCETVKVDAPELLPVGDKLYSIPEDGKLAELDPTTFAVVRTIQVAPHHDTAIALTADDSGNLYYRSEYQNLYRIDAATGKVDKFLEMPWAEVNTDIVWAFGSLWVTNFNDDTVWRVNTSA